MGISGKKKALENLGLSECYQFCSLSRGILAGSSGSAHVVIFFENFFFS